MKRKHGDKKCIDLVHVLLPFYWVTKYDDLPVLQMNLIPDHLMNFEIQLCLFDKTAAIKLGIHTFPNFYQLGKPV